MTCPCKDCKTRQPPDCHITCNTYKDWKKQYDEAKEKERTSNGCYPASYGGWVYTYDGHWRNHKIRRKRR